MTAQSMRSGVCSRRRAATASARTCTCRSKPRAPASRLFRYMRDRQAHWMGLGRYKHVSLHDARQKANDLGRQLYHGNDPLDAKRQAATAKMIAAARGITFGECAKKYIAAHEPS